MKQQRIKKSLLLILFLGILLTFSVSTHSVSAATVKKGWYTNAKGYKYYYVKGKKTTGWKKINGYWYYFKPSNGVLQKNKIVPSNIKNVYRYVDKNGVSCVDPVIQSAVNLVVKHSVMTDSASDRLKQVYDYLKKNSRYRGTHYSVTPVTIPSLASDYLKTQAGECIKTTCGLAYISLVLGFNPQICYLNWHTWLEIKSGSTWYVYDLSREFNSYYHKPTWFKVTHSQSGDYKYNAKHFSATISKGKVTWKQTN